MKRMNKEGPRLLDGFPAPPGMDDGDLAARVSAGRMVIDTRPAAAYAEGFAPRHAQPAADGSFLTWAGWLVPYDEDFYVLLGEGAEGRLPEIVRALALIGLDRLAGYFSHTALTRVPHALARIPQVAPADIAARRGDGGPVVLDVRHEGEWNSGHLPGAVHIPLGHLAARQSELPPDQPIVTHCRSGARSAIAASLLRRVGFDDVSNLEGGFAAWAREGHPIDGR